MLVEQFVMAYRVEQDRLRAILPEVFVSLRPVLRINAELRTHATGEKTTYLEYNTPVSAHGKRGWLNIAHWEDSFSCEKKEGAAVFSAPFLSITYTPVGILGGCPAEQDNDGCFFLEDGLRFVPTELIDARKEFCNCAFAWNFLPGNAHGISVDGKSLPAHPTESVQQYTKQPLAAESAAAIPCEQILGAYVVAFERR